MYRLFQLSLVLACFASIAVSAHAHPLRPGKIYRFYTFVNFEKDRGGVSQNMMDDGINLPEGYSDLAFGFKFILNPGENFRILTKGTAGGEGPVKCAFSPPAVKQMKNGHRLVVVAVDASVGTEDGSSCDYLIQLSNGKAVDVNYYEIGT